MTQTRWYRGDCHLHSRFSDGALEPGELIDAARERGLDFLVATEHNLATPGQWQGESLYVLVIPGQEVTTRAGHWLALGVDPGQLIDWQYGSADGRISDELDAVRAVGGLCVAAHPIAPYPGGTCEYPLEQFDLVEVWNGRWDSELAWQADNEAALARWQRDLREFSAGRWRPAIGNSDAHLAGQIAHPHTVVRAESCTPRALLGGLRAGHSWIAASTEIALSLTVRVDNLVAGIGDVLPIGSHPATLTVEVAGAPGGLLTVHTNTGATWTFDLTDQHMQVAAEVTDSALVWVEMRFADGSMAAISNPVFLASGGPLLPESPSA
ncbi:CehA/McbA family metallohydrolase [Nakamurella lactea]|uniref:CehA/McbA family metallohydrolase n=1 Tax=Nakamurella lactea TaxID=459515 RepID=UPI0006880BD4|nr:CehA/McbA family metallohydrolase [Nakamurella lactea]